MTRVNFIISTIVLAATACGTSEDIEWINFKSKFNKSYEHSVEDLRRFSIFKNNLDFIRNHNEIENVTFNVGLTRDADFGDDELSENRTDKQGFWKFLRTNFAWKAVVPRSPVFNKSFIIPGAIDWRELGALNEIQDQYQDEICGSCYAFAAIAAVESHHFIRTGKLLKLSEQEIVDCSRNFGCYGGYQVMAYNHIINNGIGLSHNYPYNSKEGKCQSDEVKRSGVKVYGTAYNFEQEELIRAVAEFGPVVVHINSLPKTFRFYKEGIFYDPECTEEIVNHVVVIVGYGTDEATGFDYWILRNSWSKNWGENGYMRLAMIHAPVFHYSYFPLLDESIADDNQFEYFPMLSSKVLFIWLLISFSILLTFCSCLCLKCCKNK